ncbi:MAG: hypothetical protein JST06_08085 [Bacteroidetes bacterium]|nr:hypothetical protein [Bacteroidota bacterium]
MNKTYTTKYISASIIFSLTFSLTLFSCLSQTTNGSLENKVSSGSSSSLTQLTSNTAKKNANLTRIYSQAIGDYIRLVNKEYKLSFDTLFFGKHVYGQPDDFPDIELPEIIEGTKIKLISPEQGEKKEKQNTSAFYINLIGWVDKYKAEFTFVTFSNGMAHQFDCFINYKYNGNKKTFEILNSRFENFLYMIK